MFIKISGSIQTLSEVEEEFEYFYDWGVDQNPDSLEVLLGDNLLNYAIPSEPISYEVGSTLTNIENTLDEDKDVILDIVSIIPNDDGNSITLAINLTANQNFRAMQFRINHSPYIFESVDTVHHSDLIYNTFEDISIYENNTSWLFNF